MDILWQIFHIVMEPVPYMFVYVNQWIMKPWPCTLNVPGLHYSVNLWIETYMEPVTLKSGNLATKYPWIYGYLLQCS